MLSLPLSPFPFRNKEFPRCVERDFSAVDRNSTRVLILRWIPGGFCESGGPTRSHRTSQIEFRRSTELSDRPAAHDTRGIVDRKMPASPLVAFRYVYEPRKTPTNVHISSSLVSRTFPSFRGDSHSHSKELRPLVLLL